MPALPALPVQADYVAADYGAGGRVTSPIPCLTLAAAVRRGPGAGRQIFVGAQVVLNTATFVDFTSNLMLSYRQALGAAPTVEVPLPAFGSRADTQAHLAAAVAAYFAYPATALMPSAVASAVAVAVTPAAGGPALRFSVTNSSGLGPLADLGAWAALARVELAYVFTSYPDPGSPNRWMQATCQAVYAFPGQATYDVHAEVRFHDFHTAELRAMAASVLVLCLVSAVLTAKAMVRSYAIFARARLALGARWAVVVSWRDCVAFFNMWHVLSLVADAFLVLSNSLALVRISNSPASNVNLSQASPEMVFHSLGIFFLLFSLMKYLEFQPALYMLILAVRASILRVVLFIGTVSPLFIAYMLVGMLCFSEHPMLFGSLSKAATTLFSLLNGDSMLFIFQSLVTNKRAGYQAFAYICAGRSRPCARELTRPSNRPLPAQTCTRFACFSSRRCSTFSSRLSRAALRRRRRWRSTAAR